MKKSLIVLGAFLLSTSAFAHTVFQGSLKGSGTVCFVEVEETYFEGNIESPENFRAEVVVSLEDDHKHNSDLRFTVKPSSRPNILTGLGSNQLDQINVLVAAGSKGIEAPVSVSVKWLHVNHYHTAQCLNLKQVDHE